MAAMIRGKSRSHRREHRAEGGSHHGPVPPQNGHGSGEEIRNARCRKLFIGRAFAAGVCPPRQHLGAYKKKEHCMRKTFITLSAIAVTALAAMPASAQTRRQQVVVHPGTASPAATTTGVAGGTIFGVGLTQGWWGSTGAAAALPASGAGAAAAGGVAGVGTIAMSMRRRSRAAASAPSSVRSSRRPAHRAAPTASSSAIA